MIYLQYTDNPLHFLGDGILISLGQSYGSFNTLHHSFKKYVLAFNIVSCLLHIYRMPHE